jgi:two-component system, NtrC family, response regulator AtoC
MTITGVNTPPRTVPGVPPLQPVDPAAHLLPGTPALCKGPRVLGSAAGSHQLLWIDDQIKLGDAAVGLLAFEGFGIEIAGTGEAGLRAARTGAFHGILLDIRLPDVDGITLLIRLRRAGISIPIIVISGYLTPELEAEVLRLGAAGALPLHALLDVERAAADIRVILHGHTAGPEAEPSLGIVCAGHAMREIVSWIRKVAPWRTSVLLTGETGTGKECVARALHEASRRRGHFVPVNCSAIQDTLFESELFGHRKGSFTGAVADRLGLIEAATGGTLFLDELGDLQSPMQAKLLRFLDDAQVRRLGDDAERTVDVRVVAASNRPLQRDVAVGRFRQDLYHRFTFNREIPPLRNRADDIDALVRYLVPRICRREGRMPATVTPAALAWLRRQRWPGNVRELRNALEGALATSSGAVLTEEDIVEALRPWGPRPVLTDAGEREGMLAVLRACRGNHTAAARRLGVSRTTLWRRMRELRLSGGS